MSTPAVLTRDSFLKMSTEDLKKIVGDPTKLQEANAILDGSVVIEVLPDDAPTLEPEAPPLSSEEEAAQAEAVIAEAQAATDKIAADKAAADKVAEDEEYKAAGITVVKDASGNITKIVMTYQARDEAGNPIGRPTYLEAKSWFELTTKQRAAHENAVRFAERIKKQKLTVKRDDPNEPKQLTEDEFKALQEDLKGEDRDKASSAAKQLRDNDAQIGRAHV